MVNQSLSLFISALIFTRQFKENEFLRNENPLIPDPRALNPDSFAIPD